MFLLFTMAHATLCDSNFHSNIDGVGTVPADLELIGWGPGWVEDTSDWDLESLTLVGPELHRTPLSWSQDHLFFRIETPELEPGFHVLETGRDQDYVGMFVDPNLVLDPPEPPVITEVTQQFLSPRRSKKSGRDSSIILWMENVPPGVSFEVETTTAPTFEDAMRTSIRSSTIRLAHTREDCESGANTRHEVNVRTRARVRTVGLNGLVSDWVEMEQPARGCSTTSAWPDLFSLLKRQ